MIFIGMDIDQYYRRDIEHVEHKGQFSIQIQTLNYTLNILLIPNLPVPQVHTLT